MENLLKWIEITLVLLAFALIALFFFARSFVESFGLYYLIGVTVTTTMLLVVFSARSLMVEFDTDDNQS